MREIIELLTNHPILLILLVMWGLSAVGGIFTRAARKAEQERRRAMQQQQQRRQPSPGTEPRAERVPPRKPERDAAAREGRQRSEDIGPRVQEWPEQEPRWSRQREQAPRTPPRHARAGRPRGMTPEEAAAEIRRLMGMEPEDPTGRGPRGQEPRPEPVPETSRSSRPLSDFRTFGSRFEIHVDPHVGETIHDRHLATRRSRLAPQRAARSEPPPQEARSRRAYELSELRNLPKALVLREILGPPKALKDEWQW